MRKTLIKRKKSGKSRRNRNRRTRKMVKRGGVYKRPSDEGDSGQPNKENTIEKILRDTGDNIRFRLVQLWKKKEYDEYNGLVDSLLDNSYLSNAGRKKLFDHLDRKITTFSLESLLALEKFFNKLYSIDTENADIYFKQLSTKYAENEKLTAPKLVESLYNTYLIAKKELDKDEYDGTPDYYEKIWKDYDDITKKIISDYRIYQTNEFCYYLNKYMPILMENYLREGEGGEYETRIISLERCLTQLQEDGIPESMDHLEPVIKVRNKKELREKLQSSM
jgi:hypothetical protein